MRSLTSKLIIAFLLTSTLGIGLAAVVARAVTGQEFGRFVLGQQRNEFVAAAAAFYKDNRSWRGVGQFLRQQNLPPGTGSDPKPAPPQFILADETGLILTPAQRYRVGDRVGVEELARGAPVDVDGRRAGVVIDAASAPALTERETQYLVSVNRALLYVALGASALALLAGVLLARTLTRPLRDLTKAIQAMAVGDLEQRVPVRSADELGTLTRAFNQLSTDLARSNDIRRQMTADIAHDLRTPLAVILAYIDGLREGLFKPTPARLEAMHTEAQHLQRLVEDLRTLSLADAGELPMQRILIAPGALLERLAAAYGPQATARAIELSVSNEAMLPDVSVDPERMVQVLGNLISNALRYTPAGGHIGLSACRQGLYVSLSVEDNGSGISPDALPHVFDRFYRGDPARSQQDAESGLGLAIAKSIVEAHGGTIDARSALKQGTVFTVLLPTG